MKHPEGQLPPRPDAPASPTSAAPVANELANALRRIAICAARPAERGTLFHTLVQEAGALCTASAAVATVEADDLLCVGSGTGALSWLEGEFLPLSGSFLGHTVQRRQSQRARVLAEHPQAYPLEQELGLGPTLAVPLLLDDRAHGVLVVGREPGQPSFDLDSSEALLAIAEVAAAVVAGAAAYDRRRASRTTATQWMRDRAGQGWVDRIAHLLRAGGMACFQLDSGTGRMHWPHGALPADSPAECAVHEWLERIHPGDRERVMRALTGWERRVPEPLRLLAAEGNPTWYVLDVHPGEESAPGTRLGLLRPQEAQRPTLEGVLPAAELIRALRHEINNPLAIITGHSQLLEKDSAVVQSEYLLGAVQQIAEAGRRIGDLTTRLALAETHFDHAFVTAEGGLGVVPLDPTGPR